uniref:Uncharacterized protein n=1 Tax=Rhizophora mucronata TaxID=61149 RepID=A0A2P2Q9E7_RHIMU
MFSKPSNADNKKLKQMQLKILRNFMIHLFSFSMNMIYFLYILYF